MTRTDGFTLLEVLLALFIVAVGLLAAVGMQSSALRGTRTATVAQAMSNMAHGELQVQRVFDRSVSIPVTGEICRSGLDDELYACQVSVFPCELVSTVLRCRNTSMAVAAAHQVVVTITGPGGRELEASSVVR